MRRQLIAITILAAALLVGCNGTGTEQATPTLPPSTAGGGLAIQTLIQEQDPTTGAFLPAYQTGGWGLTGSWLPPDNPMAQGNPAAWSTTTDGNSFSSSYSIAVVNNVRTPDSWSVVWGSWRGPGSGPDPNGLDCVGKNAQGVLYQFPTLNRLVCQHFNTGIIFGGGFTFSPTPLYTVSPPPTGTITGSGFTMTYGMPRAQYFNPDGVFVQEEQANYVSPDGTVMQGPGGNIASLPEGMYTGLIDNSTPGGWSYVGATGVQVATPIPWCRFRNPSSGDYFFDTYCSTPYGYVYEGVASYLFTYEVGLTAPLYRLYSPSLGMHFYTADYNEMYNDVNYYGWSYEGIPGYIALTQIDGTTPLYRLSKNNGSHLFTTSWDEVQSATWNYGFVYEGVAGYVPMQ